MTRRDPNQELLDAYVTLLNGNITYGGSNIPVGICIDEEEELYLLLYIESIENHTKTDERLIYEITVALEFVAVQEVGEIDDVAINNLLNQDLAIVDDEAGITAELTNFAFRLVTYGIMDYDVEQNDTNNLVRKVVSMINIVEQIN